MSDTKESGEKDGDFIELFLMGVGCPWMHLQCRSAKDSGCERSTKTGTCDRVIFRRISGIDAICRMALGSQFEKYITSIDHWIAFILLGIIGGKMIVESVKPDKEDDEVKEMDAPLDLKEMFVLAVATSIDALAVGITFAF